MRNRIFALFLWLAVLSSAMAVAQESPALTPKTPIRLTKVEGRMDHVSINVKGQRLFATALFETIPHPGQQGAEILV